MEIIICLKKRTFVFTVVFLNLLAASAQTTITDNTVVSGNWTVANSPYIIEGRAIVPSGQTLTIEPGVEVRFSSSTSTVTSWFDYSNGNVGVIRVEGTIIADGTPTNQILFTRNGTGLWGTILIDETSVGSSFSHCIIEYAKESRNVTNITNPVAFSGGISIFKGEVSINNNIFRNNTTGLYVREVLSTFQISDNTFQDNGANGCSFDQTNITAINNTFFNNSITTSGQVSAIRSSNSSAFLVGNLIYNNDDFGIFTNNGGSHYLINNTVYGNNQGLRVESGANTYIYNSIFQNNSTNFATSNVGGATVEMQYSMTDDASFPTNVTDVSNNLLGTDALFTNAGSSDFSLQNNSLAIDAGDPTTSGSNIPALDIVGNPRIDNSIIDMGAIEFQQPVVTYDVILSANPSNGGSTSGGGSYNNASSVMVSATPNPGYIFTNWTENGSVVSTSSSYTFTINSDRTLVANFDSEASLVEQEESSQRLLVYPNPSSNFIAVETTGALYFEVLDVQGKVSLISTNKIIDLSDLSNGLYILKVNYENGMTQTSRLIKQ